MSTFGSTWWGRAWIEALERSDAAGSGALRRGRTAARRGAVRSVELHCGYLSARVVGSHGELHQLTIEVRQLATSEWDELAAAIAGRAAHLAALLDGELDPGVVDDASSVEVDLLPRTSDLRPDCDCDEYASPCSHAAAASYVVADELDRDPFALLLLRGRDRGAVIDLVRSARSGEPSPAGGGDRLDEDASPGDEVDAEELWSGRSLDDPLAPPPPLPGLSAARSMLRPGRRPPWEVDLPRRHGIDTRRVDALAEDAVVRAWAMLVDGRPSQLSSSARSDLARRASMIPAELPHLASLAGLTPARLRAWSAAWIMAGDLGVTVIAEPGTWQTDPSVLEAAREHLVELGVPRRSVSLNYDSLRRAPDTWLVIGPDGQWYRLAGADKHQDLRLVAGPASEPGDLIQRPDEPEGTRSDGQLRLEW